VKNIFKIVTLKNGERIELKSYSHEDKESVLSFLRNQSRDEHIFLWMHQDYEEVTRELESIVKSGNNVIVAYNNGQVKGIGISMGLKEYYFRHIDRYRISIQRDCIESGLMRELIAELVYLSMEGGKEKIIIELLPEMTEFKKEIQKLEFEQVATLPDFFMDDMGVKKDIIVFSNNISDLWKSFEEGIDLQFKPHIMED
jgi:hypothetical protein